MKKSKWRHIPNILTILRLLVVPLMAVWMISGKWTESLILFLLAEFTDILDGYIARRFNFISNFGKLVDPLADKLLQLTALFLLAHGGRLSYWFFYILCGKELAMIIGSMFFLKKEIVVSSNWVGKAAAFVLFTGIVLAFINSPFSESLLWIGVIISLIAAVVYLKGYLKQINKKSN
ncbi:MAG: CDP-alcohol phosphatidyltransferase family protein [Ruminiclostridium sp.]|nr:CDP-alcohol phosphatidyltransferase family protein [Ruminiclostridium sp.]